MRNPGDGKLDSRFRGNDTHKFIIDGLSATAGSFRLHFGMEGLKMNTDAPSRRQFLKARAVAAGSLVMPGLTLAKKRRRNRPNIVFIMVDDLGKEMISCYGSTQVRTPNIDALAAGGMRFTNAYSMPQCVPTRVTVLTGQYPFRHGWVNHYDVPRWGKGCHFSAKYNPSFAKQLRATGYATCISGKWQINDFRIQPKILNELGFDEYCLWTGYEKGNPPSDKRYWNPYIHTAKGSKTYKGRFGPDIYNRFILDFIEEHKNKPMMIYYPMALTHGPLTTTPHNKIVANRKAMVEYMDYLVGKVIKTLDENGIRNNTIVIWSADNGSAKGKTSEKGVCEPFVVNCPGMVPKGVVIDALVDFTDLLPTFCELSGAELPKGHTIDGKSFAPLILGKADGSAREWIMAMGGGATSAVRTGDGWRVFNKHEYRDRVVRDKQYKLYIGTDRKPEKLIDLEADPQEKNNIIDSREPEVKAALTKLKKVAAGFPQKDANPQYDPLPLQPWNLTAEEKKEKQKKKRSQKI